jgi:hypothetical protein
VIITPGEETCIVCLSVSGCAFCFSCSKVFYNFIITILIIEIAIISAIGAAQKIPVTPPKIRTIIPSFQQR